MKRLFIGVKILPAKKTLDFYSKLKSKLREDKIKWVPSENMHITLKFLGDTDVSLIPSISDKLKLLATKFEPFSIDIEGLGQFKKQRRTKVIWLGLSKTDKLNSLAKEVDFAMSDLGFEAENRPFKPHLTLGRTKYVSNEEYIMALIKGYENVYFQSVNIRSFYLIESVLQKSGSKYEVISKIIL